MKDIFEKEIARVVLLFTAASWTTAGAYLTYRFLKKQLDD